MDNYQRPGKRTVSGKESIDLNRVRLFVRVVEDGSFTAAAKRLGLPKSSVSKGMTALEKSLGVRLLQRTTRALNLTDAGRSWYQQVRPALASLTDSTASLSARAAEPRGRVRFTCPPDANDFVARYVARFRRQYPQVHIDVSLVSRHVDLIAEGFDLALRVGELKDSSLVVRKVHDAALALYASREYLRQHGAPKRVADLARHPCIALNAPSGRAVWTLTAASGETESVEVSCPITTDVVQFVARAVVSGLGIALLPEHMANGVRELQRVLPEWRRLGGAMCVVSPSRGYEPRAVSLFKEGLIAELLKFNPERCARSAQHLLGGEGPRRPSSRRRRPAAASDP
jgi:DNA-binding transcriptional LysR family regulator